MPKSPPRSDPPATETRTTFGLRLRSTGEMLRVEREASLYGSGDETSVEARHALTTDGEHPIFGARSPEALALVFVPFVGTSAERPAPGNFKPDDVEPVAMVERIEREIRPTGTVFEDAVKLDARYALDLGRKLAGEFEGLDAVFDVVAEYDADLKAVRYPGSEHPWRDYHAVGLAVAGRLEASEAVGKIVLSQSGAAPRRALAVLPLAGRHLHLASDREKKPTEGSLVVCLGDSRPLPAALSEALEELSAPSGPHPRP